MTSVAFDKVSWQRDRDGVWLMLHAESPNIVQGICEKFQDGKKYVAELKEFQQKRSLDANAFAWAMIHEIAGEVGITPEEVYRDAVKNIGGVSDVICIQEKAKDSFIRVFTSGHLGRQVDEMPSKLDGCVTLVCTYGSSDYSVQQMSQFIDNLLQDCAALGISTPEEQRINSLLEEWDKR